MEEKEILAITGRDRLVCYDITMTKEIMGRVVSTFRLNHPEILEYAVPEPEIFRVIIEENNQEMLSKKLLEAELPDHKIAHNLSSITFTGLRLVNDMGILEEVLKRLHELQIELFWLTRNHLGFTIYLKTPDSRELVEFFHYRFVVEQNS